MAFWKTALTPSFLSSPPPVKNPGENYHGNKIFFKDLLGGRQRAQSSGECWEQLRAAYRKTVAQVDF